MTYMVRAKMTLTEMTSTSYSPATKRVKFYCQYDPSLPEDRRFSQATPSGEMTMNVDNPAAIANLTLGQSYYVDFTPVPKTDG